jgi:hypothetical protein
MRPFPTHNLMYNGGGKESPLEKKKAMIKLDQSSLEKMEEGRRPQSITPKTNLICCYVTTASTLASVF